MKFCPECGQQNEDDAKFCGNCGTKLKMAEPSQNIGNAVVGEQAQESKKEGQSGVEQTAASTGSAKEKKIEVNRVRIKLPNGNKEESKKKIPPVAGIVGIAAAVVLLLALIFKLAGFGKTKIDLNSYVTVTTSGTDTVGTAYYTMDVNGLFMKLAETIGVNNTNTTDVYAVLDSLSGDSGKWKKLSDFYNIADSAFSGELDQTDDLSNGDKIIFTWHNNESQVKTIEKEFKVSFKYKDIKIKVENLKEIEEFDPFENIQVRFYGYEPSGTAEIENNGEYDYETPYFDYELDQTNNLSNGDKVTVTISDAGGDEEGFKENCLRSWGKIPTEISKEYTVEGLPEMEDYDPFEEISVSFNGTSPDASVSITNNATVDGLDFIADKYEKLRIGDTVTVTVTGEYGDDAEAMCVQEGKKLTTVSKEYTVENIPKYAGSLSEIPQDMQDKMNQNAQDKLNAYAASSWDTAERITEITLVGSYFLTAKENADVYDSWTGESIMNRLFLVYKVSVQAGDTPFTYYYYTQYRNMIIMEDGTCSLDLSDAGTPDDRVETADGYYYYNGYADLDTLKYKTVTANLDNYTYEENING